MYLPGRYDNTTEKDLIETINQLQKTINDGNGTPNNVEELL